MIYLIAGSSHTGKTWLAQKMMEKCHYPYFSIDHLKMGLIRSGYCTLSPESSDEELTACLWPVVREMIKTAVENGQSMIIEGIYIPFDYQQDFEPAYLPQIQFWCLVFSEEYITYHYNRIMEYENVIEQRLCSPGDDVSLPLLVADNLKNIQECRRYNCNYILIEEAYNINAMADRILASAVI